MLDVATYQADLRQYFASLESVTLAYLFGSYARQQAGPLSDLDIAVLLAGQPDGERCFQVRVEIIGGLMRLLHVNDIDLLILNQAPITLSYRVIRDGILLYARDADSRIAFTARTVSQYLDFKPILERHQAAILQRARQGDLTHGYSPYRGALERYRQLRQRLERTPSALP